MRAQSGLYCVFQCAVCLGCLDGQGCFCVKNFGWKTVRVLQTARLVGHMAGHPLPATVHWHAAVPLYSACTTLLCNDGRPGRDLRRAGALRLRTAPPGPPVSCELSNSVSWRVQGQKTGAVEAFELEVRGNAWHQLGEFQGSFV